MGDPHLDEIKSAIYFLRQRMRKECVSYADLKDLLTPLHRGSEAQDKLATRDLFGDRSLFNATELANHLRDAVSSGRLVYHSIKGWYVP